MSRGSSRFMARRRLSTGIGFSIENAATCASGMHARVGAAGSGHLHRPALDLRNHLFQRALDGRQSRLHLPAVIFGSVVGNQDLDSPHAGALKV